MAVIELYHGSRLVLPHPIMGGGNPHNDYGPGFYCTRQLALAYEWSCDARQTGFANKYELETDGLSLLHLNGPEFHILNWLAILLENRVFDVPPGLPEESHRFILERFLPDYKNCDILTGYRADDSYFSFARDRKARDDFQTLRGEPRRRDAVYMLDILREDWSNDDERLR